MNLYTYTFDGEINLCWAFYVFMQKKRKGIVNFMAAMQYLEDAMDEKPITEQFTAMRHLDYALQISRRV